MRSWITSNLKRRPDAPFTSSKTIATFRLDQGHKKAHKEQMLINRREFLTTSAAFGVTVFGFPKDLLKANAADTVITILHTNDTHSQIDPLPENDKNAGKGGVARRATLVKRIRKETP